MQLHLSDISGRIIIEKRHGRRLAFRRSSSNSIHNLVLRQLLSLHFQSCLLLFSFGRLECSSNLRTRRRTFGPSRPRLHFRNCSFGLAHLIRGFVFGNELLERAANGLATRPRTCFRNWSLLLSRRQHGRRLFLLLFLVLTSKKCRRARSQQRGRLFLVLFGLFVIRRATRRPRRERTAFPSISICSRRQSLRLLRTCLMLLLCGKTRTCRSILQLSTFRGQQCRLGSLHIRRR